MKSVRPSHASAPSLLTVEQVMQRIQRGKSWIYQACKEGRFVQPTKLSTRCTRWHSAHVDQWIEQQFDGDSK